MTKLLPFLLIPIEKKPISANPKQIKKLKSMTELILSSYFICPTKEVDKK